MVIVDTAHVAILVDSGVNGLGRLVGSSAEDQVSNLSRSVNGAASARALTMLKPVEILSAPAADGKGHALDVLRHSVKVVAVTR